MTEADIAKLQTHLRKTFSTPNLLLKPRAKVKDSAEVYAGDEFLGVIYEDEDEDGSFMFEMAILAEDLV